MEVEGFVRYSEAFVGVEPQDVEVATSLLELAKERLDGVDGMKELESIYILCQQSE